MAMGKNKFIERWLAKRGRVGTSESLSDEAPPSKETPPPPPAKEPTPMQKNDGKSGEKKK
jgi:hypothetical protein